MKTITIANLLNSLPKNSFLFLGDDSQEIRAITWDYQKVVAKTLYFCLEQEEFQEDHIETNSLDYWRDAVESGAVCLVTARNKIMDPPPGVSILETEDVNSCMCLIAKAFYDDPLSNMKVVGITGTNGKTTTSQMLDSILLQSGKKTGVIGTLGIFYPSGKQEAGLLTNPLVTELLGIGQRMREEQVEFLTMEVTSHAMAFQRNNAIDFDIAIFTNLTQDHLDYHKTIESYKNAKLKLFKQLGKSEKKAYSIINDDDATGKDFVDSIDRHLRNSGKVEVLTYGIRNKDADLVAYPRQMTGAFSEFDVFLRGNHLCQIHLPMAGLFNIYNSLAAFGGAFALGISIEQIVEGLRNARNVDGRFEKISCEADFDVYVDYAHTPDGLTKILQEIRTLTKKKVIAVFGCGGDRDRLKRPQMGKTAAAIADVCIVTSDNPRTEDPGQIIQDIIEGIPQDKQTHLMVEPDRLSAIHLALDIASAEDAVLIAGKGHETHQIIGNSKNPFSDRQVVQEFFQGRREKYSRAWIEINLDRLRRNFSLICQDKPEELKFLTVVKDDALGHGMVAVAGEAIEAGSDYLGVARITEAMRLRKEFENVPILVFGERSDDEILSCVQHNLTIQIQSVAKAELISRVSLDNNKQTRVHLKVDTGMGRYGVPWEKAVELFKSIRQIPGIELEGIMTHFAQADEADKSYANLQWQRFNEILTPLDQEKILPPLVHACNSGGYLDLPLAHGNMVRIGTLPCGVYPSKVCRRIEIKGEKLQPVMSVKSRVSFLKMLNPGACVGYGMHFKAEQKIRIAIIPLGYGDGYPRLRNKGFVLIRGQKAPIIGGNSMDATMVDASAIPEVQVDDEVVLLGEQGNNLISAMMIADWANTVTYEILASWSLISMDRLFTGK